MASVEIIDAELRTVRLIHRPDRLEQRAPVRRRSGIAWVVWGGMIRREQARQQLRRRCVLIEIVGWTASDTWDFQRVGEEEHLQGCLVRGIDGTLVVFGLVMGTKPMIVHAPGKRRITGYPPLGTYPPGPPSAGRQRFPHEGEAPPPEPLPYGGELSDAEWFSAMEGSKLQR